MTDKYKPSPSVLRMEGEMTIYRASELKQTLLEALNQSTALTIDLSAVTEMDTAGLQILVLAKKVAQSKQQELQLVAHSAAVQEVFELLNLAEYFGAPANGGSGPTVGQVHANAGAFA